MRGAGDAPPPRSSWSAILATALAAAGLVAGLSFLTREFEVLLLLGSFAPSALIVFAYPDSPFAQPRNVLLGHLIGSACGLAVARVLPDHWWAAPLAVGLAIGLMKAARAVHPPACSNPLIIFALNQAPWSYLLCPTLAGAALIVAAALLYHNLRRPTPWPRYWL
jgi:CBS-domain-containing membrane protein